MPWKETRVPDERLKFIAEVLSGEGTVADLCRRFGISRKTGYKWKKRYEVSGAAGLEPTSSLALQCRSPINTAAHH